MSPVELDARFTFDAFVVGAANRLACAAARRVAEAPGSSYNPLFLYSASGLGKTHLVTATGHLILRLHPGVRVDYDTVERFMEEVMAAIGAGERDSFRGRMASTNVLILDDVQFLAGRHRMQEELLRAWDALTARGGQLVLASDRPPHEIDGLDERLLSRFSGGLIVDIGAPDYETRVAIVRRKANEREQTLEPGVAEALARLSLGNVRELQGALNRVLALQELDERRVRVEEVSSALGLALEPRDHEDLHQRDQPAADEFGSFIADMRETVEELIAQSPAEQNLADAILRWEVEGFQTRRLDAALTIMPSLSEVEVLIRGFEGDIERLREIALEIAALDPGAPELSRLDVLRDPDRLTEATAMLEGARERAVPLPVPPPGPELEALELPDGLLAVRAATAVSERPGDRYNPLFIYGDVAAARALVAATGRRLARRHVERAVAYVEAPAFAAELIHALERNTVEGWRHRYHHTGALIIERVDRLAETERAQQELFHLFDALQRDGVQLIFSAPDPPAQLSGLEERLRTRLASGLVAGVPAMAAPPPVPAERGVLDEWFLNREKVVWEWPYPGDLVIEEIG